jgi:dynein assembly factor 1, axonemal
MSITMIDSSEGGFTKNDESPTRYTFDDFPVMSKEAIRCAALEHGGYSTPALNDTLYLHYKGYRDIDNLEEYINLKTLWLDSNGLQEIKNMGHLHQLKSLFLQRNLISSIKNVNGLHNLVQLDISENSLTSLNGLEHLPELSSLNVSKNSLSNSKSISAIKDCPKLSSIDFSHNCLDGEDVIDTLSLVTNLLSANMKGNPITTKAANYRKRMICAIKTLRYLDTPIFDMERAAAEAWSVGGREAELEVKTAWQNKIKKEERESLETFRQWQLQVREQAQEKMGQTSKGLREEELEVEATKKNKADRKIAAAIEAQKEREMYHIEVSSTDMKEYENLTEVEWNTAIDEKLILFAEKESCDFDQVANILNDEFKDLKANALDCKMRWMILMSQSGTTKPRPLETYINGCTADRLTFEEIQSKLSNILIKPEELPSMEDGNTSF